MMAELRSRIVSLSGKEYSEFPFTDIICKMIPGKTIACINFTRPVLEHSSAEYCTGRKARLSKIVLLAYPNPTACPACCPFQAPRTWTCWTRSVFATLWWGIIWRTKPEAADNIFQRCNVVYHFKLNKY